MPESCTSASWAPCTVNLFAALTKGRLVSLAMSAAAASPNPGAALMPVPTAVPPSARLYTPFNASSIMNRRHISEIELGKREVGIITLQVIARGLSTAMETLLKGF